MSSSSTPRGKSLERMNALQALSQQHDSSSSETDNSENDNLPLATKGQVAIIMRMAITHAVQQSRHRGNVPKSRSGVKRVSATMTVKINRSNTIPPGVNFRDHFHRCVRGEWVTKVIRRIHWIVKRRTMLEGWIAITKPNGVGKWWLWCRSRYDGGGDE